MDLYNNQIGRQIAISNPNASPAELADFVKKAPDNGDLVVVNSKGHLDWSNKVAVGHHGISIQLDNVPNALNRPAGNASACCPREQDRSMANVVYKSNIICTAGLAMSMWELCSVI